MGMAMPPGGRRPISDDTKQIAVFFLSVLLIVFFLLVIRMHFDAKDPSAKPFIPKRGMRWQEGYRR